MSSLPMGVNKGIYWFDLQILSKNDILTIDYESRNERKRPDFYKI